MILAMFGKLLICFAVTAPCDIDEFCYANTALIQDYLNMKHVWKALGVPSQVQKFVVGSEAVAEAFSRTADLAISMEPQVLYLLNSGIDVLFYNVQRPSASKV